MSFISFQKNKKSRSGGAGDPYTELDLLIEEIYGTENPFVVGLRTHETGFESEEERQRVVLAQGPAPPQAPDTSVHQEQEEAQEAQHHEQQPQQLDGSSAADSVPEEGTYLRLFFFCLAQNSRASKLKLCKNSIDCT